mmetsp:Transcript_25853/g.61529  ORF Transcript_25853/g.61529 Transcript_25853/m.61529 type:complete len:167 (-) Transcript_25853:3-503(-)
MYEYVPTLREHGQPGCEAPSFRDFCQRPFLLGLQSKWHGCRGLGGVVHDFAHVEPAAQCLVTKDGRPAIDYVLRMHLLGEDFEAMRIQYLNTQERRAQGAAPLPPVALGWERKPSENAGMRPNRHQERYDACGKECLWHIARYYSQDFELFGYPLACPGHANDMQQ